MTVASVVLRVGYSSLSYAEKVAWAGLFARCFGEDDGRSRRVIRKYELGGKLARFALLVVDGKTVASYAGLICRVDGKAVFLSTDTMSDGTVSKASVRLASVLYPHLRAEGVVAVCGFPNKNIEGLRRKHLGWEMRGAVHAYVGVPFLWRYFLHSRSRLELLIQRPVEGFFGSVPGFIRAWSPQRDYEGRILSIRFTLSARRPGFFWIRVPSSLVQPRRFGFKVLAEDSAISDWMIEIAAGLCFDSIDVP